MGWDVSGVEGYGLVDAVEEVLCGYGGDGDEGYGALHPQGVLGRAEDLDLV